MIPRPLKRISERIDSVADELQTVSNQVVTATKVGTVAFVLISIVAVTALIVTIGVLSNAR
jgi:hypothetical protein